MARIVYKGPADQSATYVIRAASYTFDKDVPKEVPDEVAMYFCGLNPERHTMEKALLYGTPLFEMAPESGSARRRAAEGGDG